MSDAPSNENSAAAKPMSAARLVLRIVLLLVVVVLTVLLVIDRVSLTKYNAAIEELKKLMPSSAQDGEVERRPVTRDQIEEALGQAPLQTLTDKGAYQLEIYQWNRGLPMDHPRIYISYTKGDPPVALDWSTEQETLYAPQSLPGE